MKSHQAPPPECLSPFVERLFVQALDIEAPTTPIPAASSSLIMINVGASFAMRDREKRCVSVPALAAIGPVTLPSVFVEQRISVRLVAARLRPGILPRLFEDRCPLVDEVRSLECLPGVNASVRHAIKYATDDATRLEYLTTFIKDLLRQHLATADGREQLFERAITLINEGAPDLQVSDIVKALNVSGPTLRSAFKVGVGLSPKRFLRIRRMEQILRDFHKTPDLVHVAQRYGFHDQAHFIREFHDLCGITPGRFIESLGVPQGRELHNNLG